LMYDVVFQSGQAGMPVPQLPLTRTAATKFCSTEL
jgi:hypothetical protein